jgi:hypothetical protein
MTEIPAVESGERMHGEDKRDPSTSLWKRRLTLLVCGTAGVAGLVLAGEFAARQAWAYAAISLFLIGWAVLAEAAAASEGQAPHRPKGAKTTTRFSAAVVRTVAGSANAALGGFVIIAALSLLQGAHALGAAVAVSAALMCWDLHHFRRRLDAVAQVIEAGGIARDHLRRLAAVLLFGLILSLAALFVRVRYQVGTAVFLSLLALFGLSRAIAYVRRASD